MLDQLSNLVSLRSRLQLLDCHVPWLAIMFVFQSLPHTCSIDNLYVLWWPCSINCFFCSCHQVIYTFVYYWFFFRCQVIAIDVIQLIAVFVIVVELYRPSSLTEIISLRDGVMLDEFLEGMCEHSASILNQSRQPSAWRKVANISPWAKWVLPLPTHAAAKTLQHNLSKDMLLVYTGVVEGKIDHHQAPLTFLMREPDDGYWSLAEPLCLQYSLIASQFFLSIEFCRFSSIGM